MGVSALIIDDHPLILDAVRMTMNSLGPGSRVDMASSFGRARRLLESEADWDFALLDLSLPDCEGFEGLAALRELRPGLPAIVLSGRTDRETILRCIDLGAAGYIPKTSRADVISDALRLVASGHVYLPRGTLGQDLLREPTFHLVTGSATAAAQGAGEPLPASSLGLSAPPRDRDATDPRKLGLTDRQCDVLRLILRGLPNKLICRQLDLAEGTVKVHVSAVLRALGVRNRTQAVIAASRLGLRLRPDGSA